MMRITDDEGLAGACERLAEADADLARAYRACGPPPLRYRPPTYDTLLRIIVAQQVSVASANAIWGRLQGRVGTASTAIGPADFLGLSDADLKAVGFSRQKTAYGRAIAQDLEAGRVDLEAISEMDDETAILELVKFKGIGRWSAECFLLFSLGRPDVWPADDLGLMVGMERVKRMRRLAEPWRPWRSAAARLLWHVRRQEALPQDP